MAINVAGIIEPALQASEIRRAAHRPTSDLTAYDLCLRAQPLYWSLGKEGIFQALALLEEAIARDPQYGPALTWAAMCRLHVEFNGWRKDTAERLSYCPCKILPHALQNSSQLLSECRHVIRHKIVILCGKTSSNN